jgi:hypothetical protein
MMKTESRIDTDISITNILHPGKIRFSEILNHSAYGIKGH